MPISPISFAAVEGILDRLSSESRLAQPGRDDGLIPCYSLVNDLADAVSNEPRLQAPILAVRALLESLLDAALPFDEATLLALRGLVDSMRPLPGVGRVQDSRVSIVGESGNGRTNALLSDPRLDAKDCPREPHFPQIEENRENTDVSAYDCVLDLNLDENRDLLCEFNAEALDLLAHIEASLLILDEQPNNLDALHQLFRSFHTLKGVSAFLRLAPIHILAHEVESLLDMARNGRLQFDPTIVTVILESRDAVLAMLAQITLALEQGVLPSKVVPVSHLIRAVRQHAGARGFGPSGSADTAPDRVVPFDPAAGPIDPPTDISRSENKIAVAALDAAGASGSVRVNIEKLDAMLDVVGELVIVQSQILESSQSLCDQNSDLARTIARLGRITKELQRHAMSVRLVPIRPTFRKMERIIRDLARDFGKKIYFEAVGEDTEVDRTLVEEIAGPLVHMVRNSVDHGIETPSARLAAGKSEFGNVTLKAYHRGSHIYIELGDDGRGIDPELVRARAVEKGVIAPGARLSREEVLNLIFCPGFSTADKVTAISGRGVGMDVVKRNIEKLRGQVEIETGVGKGTLFCIKLPLTMAIIDGLVVRVGADRFILPSLCVQMALRPAGDAIVTVQGRGEVLDHRGHVVPFHRLNRRFRIPGAVENPAEGIVVLLETSGRLTGLLVDEMISKQEVVIKNLGGILSGIPGISGGAILGDGNIALVLDPASLFAA